MRLLDAGCGPGSITLGLADAVTPGQVTGVDISWPSNRGRRTAAADDAGAGNVNFAEANVYDLPFDDQSFDAVFAHALFQHLEEPAAALCEFSRVLAPAGVIGLADADFDGSVIWPASPDLKARALKVETAVRERAGGDPRIGRRLGTLLAEAGFQDIVVSAVAKLRRRP